MTETVHGDGFTATLTDERIMRLSVDKGVLWDGERQREYRKLCRKLSGGDPYVTIADVGGVAYVDSAAREMVADDADGLVLASAIVVTPGIGEYSVRRAVSDHAFDRPVELFFDPVAAEQWARSRAEEFRQSGCLG